MHPTKSVNRILLAGIVATSLLCGATAAEAGLALDVYGSGDGGCGGGCGNRGVTFGWGFTLTRSITVDGLGVYGGEYNACWGYEWGESRQPIQPIAAGLWTSTGTLLASTTITDASTPVGSWVMSSLNCPRGRWLFNDIAALTLVPGNYLVGSIWLDGVTTAIYGHFTTIPEITNMVIGIGSYPNGGFQAPMNIIQSASYPGGSIFSANLRTQDAPPPPPPPPAEIIIPEIDSMAGTGAVVLLAGVLTLAGERRRTS